MDREEINRCTDILKNKYNDKNAQPVLMTQKINHAEEYGLKNKEEDQRYRDREYNSTYKDSKREDEEFLNRRAESLASKLVSSHQQSLNRTNSQEN